MRVILGVPYLLYKLYVGLVFVTTLLLLYPFFLILLSRKSWYRYTFPLNIFWSHLVRVLMWVYVRKVHKVPVPEGPYLIVANHASYFDIFLMYSILPQHRFLFMGKSEILSYPLVRLFFKKLNIPVYRKDRLKAAKSFIQAKQSIQNGWSIVVFPEGGIPDEHIPEMIPFKDGAFKLAKSAGIPIVSVTFLDNWHMFSDPGHLFGPAHPGISRVYMHPVISAEEVKSLSEKELSAKVFDLIAEPLVQCGWMKCPKRRKAENLETND